MRWALAIPFLLLAAAPDPARAQVRAPALVEDELPAVEEPRPAPPPPPVAAAPVAEGPRTPTRAEAVPAEPPRLRAIEPVRSTWAGLLEAWRERRRALREQDVRGARAAAARVLDAKRDLALDDLHAFAASEVREADRSLQARLPADAVEHAELAVQLAPDLADAWLAVARTRLARDPSQLASAGAGLVAALQAAAREPHTVRAFVADVLAAAMAALAAAAAATVVVLFLRRARGAFHDLGHLPVLRSGTRLQAVFVALVLLGLPVALGLGPWAALAALALFTWLYLGLRERLVVTAALASLALLPSAAGWAAGLTAWTGSLAEEVFELEHGADGGERAARLEARTDLPPAAMAALGRWHKRRGDLDAAERWYGRTIEAGGRTPELLVNVGNVRFLRGDVDGAKAAWLDVADHAAAAEQALAAASYNLSKLYLRQSALEQSQQARRRAQLLDEAFIARNGSDDDFRANRWILDVPVALPAIRELAHADGTPGLAAEAVRARLAGGLPPAAWPLGPLALLALLWLLGLAGRSLRPSGACARCGRPACARCDAQAGPLCGQCVNVFVRKGVVEPRDRARKEAQVRRHEAVELWTARVLALLGGGAGHVWRGDVVRGFLVLFALAFLGFVLVFWRGLVPPPHPTPYLLAGKLAVAVPLGLLLYGLAVRDAWRRDRG